MQPQVIPTLWIYLPGVQRIDSVDDIALFSLLAGDLKTVGRPLSLPVQSCRRQTKAADSGPPASEATSSNQPASSVAGGNRTRSAVWGCTVGPLFITLQKPPLQLCRQSSPTSKEA